MALRSCKLLNIQATRRNYEVLQGYNPSNNAFLGRKMNLAARQQLALETLQLWSPLSFQVYYIHFSVPPPQQYNIHLSNSARPIVPNTRIRSIQLCTSVSEVLWFVHFVVQPLSSFGQAAHSLLQRRHRERAAEGSARGSLLRQSHHPKQIENGSFSFQEGRFFLRSLHYFPLYSLFLF